MKYQKKEKRLKSVYKIRPLSNEIFIHKSFFTLLIDDLNNLETKRYENTEFGRNKKNKKKRMEKDKNFAFRLDQLRKF